MLEMYLVKKSIFSSKSSDIPNFGTGSLKELKDNCKNI
jgi:hypothetical protein